MRGKKSFSGINLPIKGSYNKTFDSHTDRFTASKVFWKREIWSVLLYFMNNIFKMRYILVSYINFYI